MAMVRLDNVARCDSCGSAFAFRTAKAKACYAKKKAAYVNAASKAKLAVKAVEQAYYALKADVQWHWQDDACAWIKQGKTKSKNKIKQGKTKSKNKLASRFALSLISRHTANAKFARQPRLVLPAVPCLCPPSSMPPVVPPVGEGMTGSSGRYANAETDSSKDSDTTTEAEESPLAVGTVFTGFECDVPKAPTGTAWYPHDDIYGQGRYILALEEQEIPPPEDSEDARRRHIRLLQEEDDQHLKGLLQIQKESSWLIDQDERTKRLLKVQKESSLLIAQWLVRNIDPVTGARPL